MSKSVKKGFVGAHAKSSAAVVSLAVHSIIILVAMSFVAVRVIVKEGTSFEVRSVTRPKMQLKKLQVPVKINKKRPKPKLMKRLVVKPNLARKMPEFKMPEILGVKGGLGSVGDVGLGAGGVGFSMPEINIFGVKSRGEKIFFILDATPQMMYDEIGGFLAYAIIKNEVLQIIDSLNSTVLFNVAVFDGSHSKVLFPRLVPASSKNVVATKSWLEPLNRVSKNMGDMDYGLETLGAGNAASIENFEVEPLERYVWWMKPAMLSMKQQADSVYLLTYRWGNLTHDIGKNNGDFDYEKREKYYRMAQQKLKEENERRRKNGDPPRVLKDKGALVKEYFPNQSFGRPPSAAEKVVYTPKVMVKAMKDVRVQYAPKNQLTSGVSKKNKDAFSVNVIQFFRKSEGPRGASDFKQLSRLTKGKYSSLAGLDAIKSSSQTE